MSDGRAAGEATSPETIGQPREPGRDFGNRGAITTGAGTRALLRRWPLLLVGLVFGAALGVAAGQLLPERFEANAFLLVVPTAEADEGTTSTSYAQVYSRIATQPVVRAAAAEGADLDELGQGVSVNAFPDAPIIQISGRDEVPERAAARANGVGRALLEFGSTQADGTGYELRLLAEAIPPTDAVGPHILANLVAGTAVGLFLASLVALALPHQARHVAAVPPWPWQDPTGTGDFRGRAASDPRSGVMREVKDRSAS